MTEANAKLLELLKGDPRTSKHHFVSARDEVWICPLDQGGIISFVHGEGAAVHSLNDPSGFRRRLKKFGLTDEEIDVFEKKGAMALSFEGAGDITE